MLMYIVNKLMNMFVYPLNQAGGWGYAGIEIEEEKKEFNIIVRPYGCAYNTPYIEDYKMGDKYLNFLRSKGWKVQIIKEDY